MIRTKEGESLTILEVLEIPGQLVVKAQKPQETRPGTYALLSLEADGGWNELLDACQSVLPDSMNYCPRCAVFHDVPSCS